VAGGAEAFRALAASIGRIDRAVTDLARLTAAAGREQNKAGIASGLRGQLQSAVTSPAMMRGLTEVLSQKLGGEATGEIKESVKRYNTAIRRVIQARDRETEATQQVSKLTVQRANVFQQSMPNLYRALLAGTATPQQMAAAQIFGGARFTNLTQRMQQAQQTAAQQAGIGTQQQQVARVWAQRGQQAALGPGGIPQAGGFLAGAGRAITSAGLGGMGTIAGSLFGHQGAAIGFSFDMALKSVTAAFKELDRWVRDGTKVVSEYARFSPGGVFAQFTIGFEEFKKMAYVSRRIQLDMAEFAKAQANNIRAWRDIDIQWEKLRLNLGTIGANMQAGIGNFFANNFGAAKDFVLGAASGAMTTVGMGGVPIILQNIYDLLTKWFGTDESKKDDAQRRRDMEALLLNHPVKIQIGGFADVDWGKMALRHKQALQGGFGLGQWGPLPAGAIGGGALVNPGGRPFLFPNGPQPGGGPGQGGVLGWRGRGAGPQFGRGGAGAGGGRVRGGAGGANPLNEADMQKQFDEEMREFKRKEAAGKQGEVQKPLPEWHIGRGVDVGMAPTGLPPQDRNVPWQRDIGPDLRMS
jgi:hypothetical protein